MDPQRLASVLDAGEEMRLGWEPPRTSRALALAGTVLGLALTFLVALAGAGAVMHALRGPHVHDCGPRICTR